MKTDKASFHPEDSATAIPVRSAVHQFLHAQNENPFTIWILRLLGSHAHCWRRADRDCVSSVKEPSLLLH